MLCFHLTNEKIKYSTIIIKNNNNNNNNKNKENEEKKKFNLTSANTNA
jgi:hypothetical protein